MGAYKQFNSQDLIVSPFEVNKSFTFIGGTALANINVDINRFKGLSVNFTSSANVRSGYNVDVQYSSTSTSTATIGTEGDQTLITIIIGINLGFVKGDTFNMEFNVTNKQTVDVISYNPENGEMVYNNPFKPLGSGNTQSTWTISISAAEKDRLSSNVSSIYNSVKQIYYGNYISSSDGFVQNAITSSVLLGANNAGDRSFGKVEQTNYYDYPQTTLWPSRTFPTPSPATSSVPIGVVSIPSKLWGDYIQPNSFLLEGPTGSIKDDGEGRLLFKSTASGAIFNYMAGNIIYEHGMVTVFDSHLPGATASAADGASDFYGDAIYGTSLYGGTAFPYPLTSDFINAWISNENVTMSFSSSYTLLNTITGSYFSPYITTIGLYDEDFQLLAIGKLSQPLQSSQTTDTTILVNIDR